MVAVVAICIWVPWKGKFAEEERFIGYFPVWASAPSPYQLWPSEFWPHAKWDSVNVDLHRLVLQLLTVTAVFGLLSLLLVGKTRQHAAAIMRVGIGYDYHRLVAGRKLRLGGVEISFDRGLAGHSDGDVLTHAICDALLGAAGLGDLGQHFPDTDPQWKDASSLELLRRVVDLIGKEGWRVAQADTVVVAEQPKLAGYFDQMRAVLAGPLAIAPAQVNIKAKTTEGQEAIGRGEAMAAHAIVLLEPA